MWWPDEILQQKRFLLCINNQWKYENKQYIIEKPYKIATRNAKTNVEFSKICYIFWAFLKKQCLQKMGVTSIKQLPRPSKIASFSGNLNMKAILKVSFKNIDWFQKYEAFKSKIVKKLSFIRKMALKNHFQLQSLVFLKPVKNFEWNFQEDFHIEIH